jgi:hypothetical protein
MKWPTKADRRMVTQVASRRNFISLHARPQATLIEIKDDLADSWDF